MLFTLPEQVPARPPHANSRSQFLDNLSSSVSDLLCTGQGTVSTVPQPDVAQEFMTLMEDKFTDNSLAFYKQNLYEYEQGTAAAVVKGRLRAHLLFWVEIGAPPWVIETIRSGYVIPFETIPPGVCLSNNRSALEHGDFVSSAVCDLLELGLISEVLTPPTVINPLSVSVNSEGKPRLILDLRHVNSYIPKAKFKMEDWKVFLQYLSRGGYMYKFDLKSGYHHIDICQPHQQFLGFQWALGGAKNRYFCFTVLPFGLSSAPYLFTKIFRPLVRYWRGLGIHLVLYLDDGAGCENDFLSTQHCSDIVRSDLVRAGLVPNCDKSVWTPVQRLEWLGISWDLLSAILSIPQPRIDRLLSALSLFKDRLPFVTPRFVASIVGKIISLSPCVGNISLIMSRFLQSAVTFRDAWDTPLDLSRFQFYPQCLDEIHFWLDNCSKLNCRKLFEYSRPVSIICTDASAFACGGHALFVDKEEFELFYKAFSSMESTLDSNGRELLAILYSLKSFKSLIQGKVVKLYTDSKNASVIASKGSTSLRLQRHALEIFQFCAVNNVSIEIEWVPRSLNEYADSLSRVIDFDDWSVSTDFFAYISSLFGPFTVDRFACPDSAKCARFYSKFWCPGAEGVDAFSVDWAGENNWLVPPIYLISRTIFHLEVCGVRGVLDIPKWLSAAFWPTVFPMGGLRPFVRLVVEFPDPSFVFAPLWDGHNTIFCLFRFKSAVLALLLDGSSLLF